MPSLRPCQRKTPISSWALWKHQVLQPQEGEPRPGLAWPLGPYSQGPPARAHGSWVTPPPAFPGPVQHFTSGASTERSHPALGQHGRAQPGRRRQGAVSPVGRLPASSPHWATFPATCRSSPDPKDPGPLPARCSPRTGLSWSRPQLGFPGICARKAPRPGSDQDVLLQPLAQSQSSQTCFPLCVPRVSPDTRQSWGVPGVPSFRRLPLKVNSGPWRPLVANVRKCHCPSQGGDGLAPGPGAQGGKDSAWHGPTLGPPTRQVSMKMLGLSPVSKVGRPPDSPFPAGQLHFIHRMLRPGSWEPGQQGCPEPGPAALIYCIVFPLTGKHSPQSPAPGPSGRLIPRLLPSLHTLRAQ